MKSKRRIYIPSILKNHNLNDIRLYVHQLSKEGLNDLDSIEKETYYPRIVLYYAIKNTKSLSHIHSKITPLYTLKQLYLIERASSLLMPLSKVAVIANVNEDSLRLHNKIKYWEVEFVYRRDQVKLAQKVFKLNYDISTDRMPPRSVIAMCKNMDRNMT